MKILYNDNKIKINYNDLALKKILYNYTKYELTGDNIINIKLNKINSSDITKYWGSDAKSIIDTETGVNLTLGSGRDYWYKLNFNMQPNTNYRITINVNTNLNSETRILGAKLGNETSKYECGLGFLYVKNLVDGVGVLEFTTPKELKTDNGIYLGCLGNTATATQYLNINSIIIGEIIYKNVDHMRWLSIGDSISAGVGTTKTYIDFICEETGLVNVTGNRISGGSVTLIGDGTLTGSGFTYMPNYISYTVKEMYTRPLLITIWLGTNDHIGNVPIGEDTSTNVKEFWGALNYFLPKLKKAYPNAYIIYFTPAKKRNMSANTAGHTLMDYINTIKAACKKYDIYCADLYTDTYDALDIDTMTADGLHFNITGHETVIAPYIKSMISKYVLGDANVL